MRWLLVLFTPILLVAGEVEAVIPPGVTHVVDEDARHVYIITLLKPEAESRDETTYFAQWINGLVAVRYIAGAEGMAVITDRPIADLKAVVDQIARTGKVAYWVERECWGKQADAFVGDLYVPILTEPFAGPETNINQVIQAEGGGLTLCLNAWEVSADQEGYQTRHFGLKVADGKVVFAAFTEPAFESADEIRQRATTLQVKDLPIRYAPDKAGTVRVNKLTAHCKAHSRWALRIWDDADRYVWQELDTVVANPNRAVGDVDGDGIDEIVHLSDDHGTLRLIVWGNRAAWAGRLDGVAVPVPGRELDASVSP